MNNLDLSLKAYAEACAARGWRGLVCIEGPGGRVDALCHSLEPDLVWTGSAPPDGVSVLDRNASRTALGSSCGHVVIDWRQHADADLMGRAGGMLRAGGLLVLLMPPRGHPSRFIGRVRLFAEREPWVLHVRPGKISGGALPSGVSDVQMEHRNTLLEQSEAVQGLCACAEEGVPGILLAPRGRGKSAALGMLAERLLRQGVAGRVVVSAPSRRSLESFFRHGGTVAGCEFLPPDALPDQFSEDTWLMLDEAAALGAARLRRLIESTPRLLMATTTEGYEGSGRGFLLRQLGWLKRQYPQHRVLRLERPMRWAADDPLEDWLNRLLCLRTPEWRQGESAARPIRPATAEHGLLDRDRLARDEALLQEVFALLVSAHYRTRPADLAFLLDAQDVEVHVLREAGRIVAVALTQREAGLPNDLAQAIYRGERRPPGRLLAQSLAAHVGLPEAACLDQLRIVRIAVLPERQRQGLGKRLVQACIERAEALGLSMLGAAFAHEPGIERFWRQCGLAPVHLGLRPERSTGQPSLLLVRGLDEQGRRLAEEATVLMGRRFRALAEKGLIQLPKGLELPTGSVPEQRLATERMAYVQGRRGFELALHALQPEVQARKPLPEPLATLWRLRVEEGLDWPEVARQAGLRGKRAARAVMREGLKTLLEKSRSYP
ncbi:MAG: tRNA(Met) cytidine acetyltransferase [Gammaproteobacteria bacterium]|nr:MAG: tRNA(Met) cytidine acetyltransferase [Gammaproteobacteria bacterium]